MAYLLLFAVGASLFINFFIYADEIIDWWDNRRIEPVESHLTLEDELLVGDRLIIERTLLSFEEFKKRN